MIDGIYLIIGLIIQPFFAVLAMHYGHRFLQRHTNRDDEKEQLKAAVDHYKSNQAVYELNTTKYVEEIKTLKAQLANTTAKNFPIVN